MTREPSSLRARALARLDEGLSALGLEGRRHLGPLSIEVRVETAEIEVDLGGHVRRFEIADPEGCREGCDLALDLVAAALFGELRVRRHHVGSAVRSWETEVLVHGRWVGIGRQGRLGVIAGLSASTSVLENPRRRPDAFAGFEPSGLPFAPWSGTGGFYGHDEAEPQPVEIDGVLDLHNHSPKDVKVLVLEYIEQCRGAGITELRIIHGKGKGVLRRTVHSILERHPEVRAFRLGGQGGGSWGATIVDLSPPPGADYS